MAVYTPNTPITLTCIMGPTASGKTAYAMERARAGGVEIISVDSAMIYRGLNIGAAKPTPEELALAPHHLIDICDPTDAYSAAQFVSDTVNCVNAIIARGQTPLLVGGTMLYFRALQVGLTDLPASDPMIRSALADELAEVGLPALFDQLRRIDPHSADRINPHDPQRILRALEVYRVSGQTLTQWWANGAVRPDFHFDNWAIMPVDRAVLHARIAERFDAMLAAGFIDELVELRARGDLDLTMPSMRCVGYRQVWQYLDGELTFDEMRERAIIATRQLAKRQLTWLRSWPLPVQTLMGLE